MIIIIIIIIMIIIMMMRMILIIIIMIIIMIYDTHFFVQILPTKNSAFVNRVIERGTFIARFYNVMHCV